MTLNIGCSGWSYEGWKGNFYPKDMEKKEYLSYYSKFFKFVGSIPHIIAFLPDLQLEHGKIVKDRKKDMLEYVKKVRETQDENSSIRDVLIAFNNHIAGFGPQSVNDFLKLMNMSEIDWKSELEHYENNSTQPHNRFQSSLADFTN